MTNGRASQRPKAMNTSNEDKAKSCLQRIYLTGCLSEEKFLLTAGQLSGHFENYNNAPSARTDWPGISTIRKVYPHYPPFVI